MTSRTGHDFRCRTQTFKKSRAYALYILNICVRTLMPCPVLEVTEDGSPEPSVVATGADLRVDLPKYRIYEHGQLVDEPADILSYWRDDLVSFLLG